MIPGTRRSISAMSAAQRQAPVDDGPTGTPVSKRPGARGDPGVPGPCSPCQPALPRRQRLCDRSYGRARGGDLDADGERPAGNTVGGDKSYDVPRFVDDIRALDVTPHIARKAPYSAIDARTTCHPEYQVSQRKRKAGRAGPPRAWSWTPVPRTARPIRRSTLLAMPVPARNTRRVESQVGAAACTRDARRREVRPRGLGRAGWADRCLLECSAHMIAQQALASINGAVSLTVLCNHFDCDAAHWRVRCHPPE